MSKGYISMVERGQKAPTVASLVKIADALNVSVSALFEEDTPKEPVAIVRRNERKALQGTSSPHEYNYQSITFKTPHKHMEAFIMHPPMASENDDVQFYDHAGEEFVFVLDGSIELILENHRYRLQKGDCCYFDSSFPHTYRSLSRKAAECLAVIYPLTAPLGASRA